MRNNALNTALNTAKKGKIAVDRMGLNLIKCAEPIKTWAPNNTANPYNGSHLKKEISPDPKPFLPKQD